MTRNIIKLLEEHGFTEEGLGAELNEDEEFCGICWDLSVWFEEWQIYTRKDSTKIVICDIMHSFDRELSDEEILEFFRLHLWCWVDTYEGVLILKALFSEDEVVHYGVTGVAVVSQEEYNRGIQSGESFNIISNPCSWTSLCRKDGMLVLTFHDYEGYEFDFTFDYDERYILHNGERVGHTLSSMTSYISSRTLEGYCTTEE